MSRGPLLHVLHGGGFGGLESAALDLIRFIAKSESEQHVVFLDPAPGPMKLELADVVGVQVHELPRESKRLSIIRRLAALHWTIQPRGTFVFSFGSHLLVGLGARLGGAKRVVAFIQNPPPQDRAIRKRTSLLVMLSRYVYSHFIACSEYVAQQVRTWYGIPERKLVVIKNWCDVNSIGERADGARKLRNRNGRRKIIMVSRLDPIKNHRLLVKSFALLSKERSNVVLELVGEGPLEEELRILSGSLGVEGRIIFTGSSSSVPELLGAADVFVFSTTREEGFGIVLIEALAAGIPVVTTDVGPCREVVGKCGRLVPPCPKDLAEGLAAELDLIDARGTQPARLRSFAMEHYDVSVAAPAVLKLVDA